MHLFELLLKSETLADVSMHFEQAVESAQELMKLSEPTQDRLQAAIDQLKLGLDLLRAAGFEKEADQGFEVIKNKGLLK
jgi:exonuclease VII small subunit